MHRSTLTILLMIFCFAATAGAQIVNGSFEPDGTDPIYAALPGGSTAIPGWTTTGTGVEWFDPVAHGFASPPDGTYAVDLANTVYSNGGLEQTFPTQAGTGYQIVFQLGTLVFSGRDGTCEIIVEADGQSQIFTATAPSSVTEWELKVFEFTADDTEATISLSCLQSALQHFAYIDGLGSSETVGREDATWSDVKRLYR